MQNGLGPGGLPGRRRRQLEHDTAIEIAVLGRAALRGGSVERTGTVDHGRAICRCAIVPARERVERRYFFGCWIELIDDSWRYAEERTGLVEDDTLRATAVASNERIKRLICCGMRLAERDREHQRDQEEERRFPEVLGMIGARNHGRFPPDLLMNQPTVRYLLYVIVCLV